MPRHSVLSVWRFEVVAASLITSTKLLYSGWVTVSKSISTCYQPAGSTQPGHPSEGKHNKYPVMLYVGEAKTAMARVW